MITKITGKLNRVLEDRIHLQVGPLEYELYVTNSVRQQLQNRAEEEVTLHTSHYLEGGAMTTKLVPRLIGFLTQAELEFFELFCTVDKVGVKKALKAIRRPVPEMADAIAQGNEKYLSDLPGIGPSTAEKIVGTLRKKVAKFALLPSPADGEPPPRSTAAQQVLEETHQALVAMGLSPSEARQLIQRIAGSKQSFASVDEAIFAIYQSR